VWKRVGSASGSGKMMRILADPDPQHWQEHKNFRKGQDIFRHILYRTRQKKRYTLKKNRFLTACQRQVFRFISLIFSHSSSTGTVAAIIRVAAFLTAILEYLIPKKGIFSVCMVNFRTFLTIIKRKNPKFIVHYTFKLILKNLDKKN